MDELVGRLMPLKGSASGDVEGAVVPEAGAVDEEFSNHPKSINDIRSDKSGKSEDWTPRDALIALLRDIDSGKQNVEQVVVIYAVKGDDSHFTKSFCAGPFTTYACMGLLHDAAIRMHDRS